MSLEEKGSRFVSKGSWLADGTPAEIAADLATPTVRRHLASIFAKTDTGKR
jgi:DNA-binding CsgD family transcriptional regulator